MSKLFVILAPYGTLKRFCIHPANKISTLLFIFREYLLLLHNSRTKIISIFFIRGEFGIVFDLTLVSMIRVQFLEVVIGQFLYENNLMSEASNQTSNGHEGMLLYTYD